MKKILFVIDNLGSGGAQNQATLLAVKLKQLGYDVSFFTYYPHDFFSSRLLNRDIKIYYSPKKKYFGFLIFFKLMYLLNSLKFPTVISYLDTPNIYSSFLKFIFSSKVKIIISYRSSTNFSKLSILKKILLYCANLKSDIIVSNSFHEKDNWTSRYPILLKKWHTIYNLVEKKEMLFLSNSISNYYLLVGSVNENKNGLFLIEALNYLHQNGFKIRIHWVGEKIINIYKSNDYLKRMQDKIDEYNLNEHFVWFDATLDLKDHYVNSKALILSSNCEGLPNVVCEAMSYGKPCIIPNILDHPSLIIDSVNGFLYDINSIDSFVNKIIQLERLSEIQYHEMSVSSYNLSDILFNEKVILNKYKGLLDSPI